MRYLHARSSFSIENNRATSFNIGGKTVIKTKCGGIITCLIIALMAAYAAMKFSHLLERHNPNLSQYTETNIFDDNDRLNLNEINFRLAFSIEGYLDKEMKNDPRYVKYLVRLFGRKEGVAYEQFIPYHECAQADWDQFQPTGKSTEDEWTRIKEDPKRGFYCLDWSGDYEIYGSEITNNY